MYLEKKTDKRKAAKGRAVGQRARAHVLFVGSQDLVPMHEAGNSHHHQMRPPEGKRKVGEGEEESKQASCYCLEHFTLGMFPLACNTCLIETRSGFHSQHWKKNLKPEMTIILPNISKQNHEGL